MINAEIERLTRIRLRLPSGISYIGSDGLGTAIHKRFSDVMEDMHHRKGWMTIIVKGGREGDVISAIEDFIGDSVTRTLIDD